MLEAKPPLGRELTGADLDRSVSIIRERIDKLGVSEPEVRKQGDEPDRDPAPRRRRPRARRPDHRQDRAARALQVRGQPDRPLAERPGRSGPEPEPLQPPGVPAIADQGRQRARVVPLRRTRRSGSPARGRRSRRSWRSRGSRSSWSGRRAAEGLEVHGRAREADRPHLRHRRALLPGRPGKTPRQSNYFYLLRYQPNDADNPVPEMTGEDLKLSGTRQDFGTNGEAIVLMDFTDKGADKFHDVTRDIVNSSKIKSSQGRGEVLDSFAIVLDGEIKSAPTVDPGREPGRDPRRQRRPDHRHRRRRRGEGPRPRPPDRRAPDRVRPGGSGPRSPRRSGRTR